jgi:hypothetical protein
MKLKSTFVRLPRIIRMPRFASVDHLPFFPRPCFSLLAQALMRDNWRCVVTGILDMNTPDDITADLDLTQEVSYYTECTHIIPESILFGVNPKSDDNLKVRG